MPDWALVQDIIRPTFGALLLLQAGCKGTSRARAQLQPVNGACTRLAVGGGTCPGCTVWTARRARAPCLQMWSCPWRCIAWASCLGWTSTGTAGRTGATGTGRTRAMPPRLWTPALPPRPQARTLTRPAAALAPWGPLAGAPPAPQLPRLLPGAGRHLRCARKSTAGRRPCAGAARVCASTGGLPCAHSATAPCLCRSGVPSSRAPTQALAERRTLAAGVAADRKCAPASPGWAQGCLSPLHPTGLAAHAMRYQGRPSGGSVCCCTVEPLALAVSTALAAAGSLPHASPKRLQQCLTRCPAAQVRADEPALHDSAAQGIRSQSGHGQHGAVQPASPQPAGPGRLQGARGQGTCRCTPAVQAAACGDHPEVPSSQGCRVQGRRWCGLLPRVSPARVCRARALRGPERSRQSAQEAHQLQHSFMWLARCGSGHVYAGLQAP